MTCIGLARNPEYLPSPEKYCEHLTKYCQYLDYMHGMFKAGKEKNIKWAAQLGSHAYGGPVIVVDFGTATTLDVVTKKGEYLGGVICPGIGISADALFQRAARLPRVDVRKPASVIGRSTVGSMQAGLYFGYASMVEGLIARIRAELGEPAKAVATGGLAESMAADLPSIEAVDPVLTLTGLRLIWERNRAPGGR